MARCDWDSHKIDIIIPVVQARLARELLRTIRGNTILPSRLIIIDNTQKHFDINIPEMTIAIIHTSKMIGTNEAWKTGLRLTNADFICIFNDDILLNHLFFQKMIEIVKDKECIAAPSITRKLGRLQNISLTPNRERVITGRRGCAFCIHKKILNIIPPIPDDLKIFCGDDWIFNCARVFNFDCIEMSDNPIFHHLGATTRTFPLTKIRNIREREKQIYRKEFHRWLTQQQTEQM